MEHAPRSPGVCENTGFWHHLPEFASEEDRVSRVESKKLAFLESSQVMLMLSDQGPHFQSHSSKERATGV